MELTLVMKTGFAVAHSATVGVDKLRILLYLKGKPTRSF